MGLYSSYQTDPKIETEGVIFTPDSTTAITIARAGGANVRYNKLMEAKTKPHRRQIEAGTLDPALEKSILYACLQGAVIKNWETLVNLSENLDEPDRFELVQGIEANPDAPEGTYSHKVDQYGLVPFNQQNVLATLTMLPDLALAINNEASSAAHYRKANQDADAKN